MTKMLKVVGASWLQTKISSYILGTLGVLAIMAIFLGELERIQDDGNYAATVFYSEKSGYHIEYWGQSNDLADIPRGVARAYYRQDIDTTGWAQLEIETDGTYKDKVQAYAAGLLEGALTWQTVHAHLLSTVHADCARAEKDCGRVRDQLERAASIDKKNAATYEDDLPFWHQVGLFYEQIDGIFTGWNYGLDRSQNQEGIVRIEKTDLYWLNAMSDIREIKKYLNITVNDEVSEHMPGLSSAFLKIVNETVTDNNGSTIRRKMFVAHNTAGSYNSMIRILKRYKLNYHQTDSKGSPLVPATSVQFSGYPAAVTSHDDMSVLSGDSLLLAVTGTTINNFNEALWKEVNIIDQVPIGPRVSAANRLATNVSSWVHLVASNNSGTACKQWMAVDFKLLDFKPELSGDSQHELSHNDRVYINSAAGLENLERAYTYTVENKNTKHTVVHRAGRGGARGRPRGLLWLLEQVPGHAHAADLTERLLDHTYFATYGLPYFKDIANHTHTPQMESRYGSIFSYSDSPRAALFRKAATNASSLDYIIHFMRNNNMTLLNNSAVHDIRSEDKDRSTADDKRNDTVACADGIVVDDVIDCLMNEREYWTNIAVRGDLANQYQRAFGVIDTKVFSGNADGIDAIAVVSGPTHTPVVKQEPDSNKKTINKGNVAHSTSSIEHPLIKDSNKENPTEDKANNEVVPPFQWSKSKFSNEPHEVQPDLWAFQPFQTTWVW